MDFTMIRRMTALTLLLLLLVTTTWVGLLDKEIGSQDMQDWIHAFCLTQTVLLAAFVVYGPGRFIVRMPLVCAWGLAIGFSLATNNLITSQGRASLAAGAILAVAGTLPSLLIFALHRWKMRVYLAFGNQSLSRTATRTTHQFSLQMLLILTAAFALTGVVARAAITAVPDPFGTDRDILVLHVWLGFFPCLVATPTLLVTFRPSWKILLAVGFFLVVTLVEPLLLGLVGPIIFDSMDLIQVTSWDWFRELGTESLVWHGQAVIAVVIYALLARAAGIRMFVSRQSNDKNPNPSGEPATDAGCVQD